MNAHEELGYSKKYEPVPDKPKKKRKRYIRYDHTWEKFESSELPCEVTEANKMAKTKAMREIRA